MIQNPYQPFEFDQNNFVGRNTLLGYLYNRTTNSKNLKQTLILGQGGCGKTWLLKRYLSGISEKDTHKIYIDIGDYVSDLNGFMSELMAKLSIHSKTKFSAKSFIKSITIGFPFSISVSPGALFTQKMPSSQKEMLELICNQIYELVAKKNRRVIISFDQYGLISKIHGGSLIVKYLTLLIWKLKKENIFGVHLIFAMRPERKGILEFPFGDEIFNPKYFKRISIDDFSYLEAKEALIKPVEKIGLNFSDSFIEKLIQKIKTNNPYFIQVTGYMLFEYLIDMSYDFSQQIEVQISELDDLLIELQSKLFKRFNYNYQQVLKIFAINHPLHLTYHQLRDNIQHLGSEIEDEELKSILHNLKNNSVRPLKFIEKMNAYKLNHELFADYILHNEISKDKREIEILQRIVNYLPALHDISGFFMDLKLLDNLWKYRKDLVFTQDTLKLIASSVLNLDSKLWDSYSKWFYSTQYVFIDIIKDFLKNNNKTIQKRCFDIIERNFDDSFINVLIPFLYDKEQDITTQIVIILSKSKNDKIIKEFINVYKNSNTNTKYEILRTLSGINNQHTIKFFKSVIENEKDSNLFEQAILSISTISNRNTFELLVYFLDHVPTKKKVLIIRYLVNFKYEQELIRIYLRKLKSKSIIVRLEIIRSLSVFNSTIVVNCLAKRIRSNNPYIIKESISSLSKIKSDASARVLIGSLNSHNSYVRYISFNALGTFDSRNIFNLINWVNGEKAETKIYKAKLLAKNKTKEALIKLSYLENSKNERIRAIFFRLLRNFPIEETIKYFDKVLTDKSVLVKKTIYESFILTKGRDRKIVEMKYSSFLNSYHSLLEKNNKHLDSTKAINESVKILNNSWMISLRECNSLLSKLNRIKNTTKFYERIEYFTSNYGRETILLLLMQLESVTLLNRFKDNIGMRNCFFQKLVNCNDYEIAHFSLKILKKFGRINISNFIHLGHMNPLVYVESISYLNIEENKKLLFELFDNDIKSVSEMAMNCLAKSFNIEIYEVFIPKILSMDIPEFEKLLKLQKTLSYLPKISSSMIYGIGGNYNNCRIFIEETIKKIVS